MLSWISLLILAFVAYYSINYYLCYARNLAAAKRSGLHYIIVPVYFLNRFWLITHPLWLKLLKKLPEKYTRWADFCLPDGSWQYRHDIFARVGHDTFLTCAPGGNSLWTAEASVINQITTRRNDFPKPSALYKSVNIYGANVVSSEGQYWRHHRKATSPPFTEKNNQLVWKESLDQAQAMLSSWVGKDGKGGKTIDRVMDDTMRVSLHVISNAGFGRKIEWPSEHSKALTDTDYVDPSKIQNVSEDVEAGHSMSYTYAIHCLLDNILFQFLLPRWALKNSPIPLMRKANEAFEEFGKYMKAMVADRKEQYVQRTIKNEDGGMDILAQLVKGQIADRDAKGSQYLTDPEILGNMFVLILAGHETAANSIHFALLYLALYIPTQRRLQADLDSIFNGRPPSEWDYETDLAALFNGMTGAILAEELRLVPPVINIPKSTIGNTSDQPLIVDGKKCLVPPNTYISLCTAAVQRNPAYWPSGTPLYPGGHPVHPASNLDNDLEEFKPERWLLNMDSEPHDPTSAKTKRTGSQPLAEKMDTEGIGVNTAADTSESHFKPIKGSYIPFSDGYRSCLGRRFAQVEVLAVLAVIFQNYSVELATDAWASDAELEKMTEEGKSEIWQQAAENCRDLMLNGCGVIITLQMRKGTVKLRFRRRGEEVFKDDVEDIGRRKALEREGKKGVAGEWKRDESWRAWEE